MEKRGNDERREPEIVYSRSVKAGKRIYYLDVKKSRNEDLYVCITESKKRTQGEMEPPTFEKHKLFLYKEDFAHFLEGLEDVVAYVKSEVGDIQEREEWVPRENPADESAYQDAPQDEPSRDEETPDEEKSHRFGFFHRK